jgi:hypothetical protein
MGLLVGQPLRHRAGIRYVNFSPDGSLVASGDEDGNIGVWETDTGERVADYFQHFAAVTFVGFVGDGQRLISAGRDGAVRLWHIGAIDDVNLMIRIAEPATASRIDGNDPAPLTTAQYFELYEEIVRVSQQSTSGAQFATWLLTHPSERAVAPFLQGTLIDSIESVRYALCNDERAKAGFVATTNDGAGDCVNGVNREPWRLGRLAVRSFTTPKNRS